jgi:hypothetical protein
MDARTIYSETARCQDLPELLDRHGDEVAMVLPDGSLDRLVGAVAARRAPGARLQEKVDGCWCAAKVGQDGRVESVTSRSGLHLRVAVAWIGEQLPLYLAGFTLIGEVEAGTHWASVERQAADDEGGDSRLPRYHLYGALDRAGRPVKADRVRAIGRRLSHARVCYVREAAPRESWADFVRSVLDAGGEGVIIRETGGAIFRAKPRHTCDRYCSRVYTKADRHGQPRLFADLSVATGRTFRRVQTVLVPEGMTAAQLRKRVVVVTGASLDTVTGVVRHCRIADVRPEGEKLASECTI